jgi:hypothetical protein
MGILGRDGRITRLLKRLISRSTPCLRARAREGGPNVIGRAAGAATCGKAGSDAIEGLPAWLGPITLHRDFSCPTARAITRTVRRSFTQVRKCI